jgi:Flp pilus assembly protein TadG
MHHKRLITTRKLANTKQKITMRSSNRTGRTAIAARLAWDAGGQALIETALFSMVLVLMLALAVNFAYVVYIDAGITSAGRQAATYAA